MFDTEATLDRDSRCARFEVTLESFISTTSGSFGEKIHSQPAHIQWSPQTLRFTIADTVKMNLAFWFLASDNPVRPEVHPGTFHIGSLKIDNEEPNAKSQPPDPKAPCQKAPPNKPPPKIQCFFAASDPVTGIWILDSEGVWHLQPITGDQGGRWWSLFKVGHLQEYGQFPDLTVDGFPMVEGFLFKDRWTYFGGKLYARAMYQGSLQYSGGKVLEDTTLTLRHAPLPLRK